MPPGDRWMSARLSRSRAAGRQTGPRQRNVHRLARVHGVPSGLSGGRCHHARIAPISAASFREAATSSGSSIKALASARKRACLSSRSAARIAALTAAERDCPLTVRASRARSTSGSVRIVSVLTVQIVTQYGKLLRCRDTQHVSDHYLPGAVLDALIVSGATFDGRMP
jgi:hypothetical protein